MSVWDRGKLDPERRHWGWILCVACGVAVSPAPCAGGEPFTPSRGIESGRNDVVYLAPATEPYEALPLGNGLPGVMVSNPRDGMTYKFHHSSFFASADENQMLWSSGELDVNVPDAWMAGFVEQRLILHDGVIATEFKTGDGTHRIESWIAEGMNVLVIQIRSDSPLPDLELKLRVWERAIPARLAAGTNELSLTTVGLSGRRASPVVVQPWGPQIKRRFAGGEVPQKPLQVAMTVPGDGRKVLTIVATNPVAMGAALTAEAAVRDARSLIQRARKLGEEAMNPRDGGGDKRTAAHTCLYLTAGIEMAHQIYKHYLYTRDETLLKEKAYPLLKETATFHLNFVTREEDGQYHVYPSHARETSHWVKDSVTDLSALRAVLPLLIETSARLGLDEEDRAQWQEVLANLAPFVKSEDGQSILQGKLFDDFPPTRSSRIEALCPPAERSTASGKSRFNSENNQLDPAYPWGLIGLHSPPLELDLMRRTFVNRRFSVWTPANNWDWSAVSAARLGMPEQVVGSLRQYVENVQTYPSGMASIAGRYPEQWGKMLSDTAGFESSGSMAAAVQEMLLQSYGGRICVFPACPEGWQGEFTLVAEGGFLVSAAITLSGDIPFIQIRSPLGGRCVVINPWQEAVRLKAGDRLSALGAETELAFDTTAGEIYELRPVKPGPVAEPIAVERCRGPKWPFHAGPDDTAEEYFKREDQSFGFLGITRDGLNPVRDKVRRALNPGKYLGAEVERPAKPLFRISRTDQPPPIDGKLDDACWQDRKSIGPLLILGSQRAAPHQTQVRVCYDDQALYLAALCREPRMDRITAFEKSGPGVVSIFAQDGVEIFLQASPSSYRQLAIGARGMRYDGLVTGQKHDTSQRLDCRYAVQEQADAWVVELAIPFAALGTPPRPGDRLSFNFGRNHSRLRQVSTWAPLSRFHAPDDFGQLVLGWSPAEMQPVARFSFEGDTVEEAARDSASAERRGRFVYGAVTAPGRIGQALRLEGRAYFEIPHCPDLSFENAITVEAWVYPLAKVLRVIDKSTVGKGENVWPHYQQ